MYIFKPYIYIYIRVNQKGASPSPPTGLRHVDSCGIFVYSSSFLLPPFRCTLADNRDHTPTLAACKPSSILIA